MGNDQIFQIIFVLGEIEFQSGRWIVPFKSFLRTKWVREKFAGVWPFQKFLLPLDAC